MDFVVSSVQVLELEWENPIMNLERVYTYGPVNRNERRKQYEEDNDHDNHYFFDWVIGIRDDILLNKKCVSVLSSNNIWDNVLSFRF